MYRYDLRALTKHLTKPVVKADLLFCIFIPRIISISIFIADDILIWACGQMPSQL